MKKRFLALLLAVCIAASMLVMPASASSNAAIQTAISLGGITSDQSASLSAALTRGTLARLLTAFSSSRETVGTQTTSGTLFTDVSSDNALAPYIRVAVQNGWMSGYSDGSFRPDQGVTLEEACTAVLKLLGYDVTTLSGGFPAAQLNKANALDLRKNISAGQGDGLTIDDGITMLYNALTAQNASGTTYAQSLGFTVTDGKVDTSSILLADRKGPFVAGDNTTLPFTPTTVYRNDSAASSATLNKYDVYYYSVNTGTLWIYTRKAAGRITAVSPTASAPTKVTVAGVEYSIGDSSAASQLSSLNGGGVGQVVTLLLGANNEVVSVLTGSQADEVFYGVVQSSTRSLDTTTNSADVKQTVTVACTDGITRSVNVDKSLNFPAGWLVEITVNENGENVESISEKSISGTINSDGTALGDSAFADDVQILDTTSEGLAGTISPSRLSGVTLSGSDVKYYTTNSEGKIDRIILNNVTGDLLTYVVLDDVKNLITTATSDSSSTGSTTSKTVASTIKGLLGTDSSSSSQSSSSQSSSKSSSDIASDVSSIVLPTTGDIIYGIIDGSIGSTMWEKLTSSTDSLASYALKLAADNTSGALSSVLKYLGTGASYVCYENGKQTTYKTSSKYPVVAGGIAISKSASGTVKNMIQLIPTVVDKLGAASVMCGSDRYETADNLQVYLWYRGQYYATTLSEINTDDYTIIGWRDSLNCSAGNKVRILVAVKNN